MQGRKNFNKEIKNTKHDLVLNEYPQEFTDSIMKPGRRDGASLDRLYHSTILIPYIKVISKKFRRNGNRFNVRTIFETKYRH
jgi:hypothetical protein